MFGISCQTPGTTISEVNIPVSSEKKAILGPRERPTTVLSATIASASLTVSRMNDFSEGGKGPSQSLSEAEMRKK